MKRLVPIVVAIISGLTLSACGSHSTSSTSSPAIESARTTARILSAQLEQDCYNSPTIDSSELSAGYLTVECQLTPAPSSLIVVEVFTNPKSHAAAIKSDLQPCSSAAMTEAGLGSAVINDPLWTAVMPIEEMAVSQEYIGGRILWPRSHEEITEEITKYPNGCEGSNGGGSLDGVVTGVGASDEKIQVTVKLKNTENVTSRAECELYSKNKDIPPSELKEIGESRDGTLKWGLLHTASIRAGSTARLTFVLGPGSRKPKWMTPGIFKLKCSLISNEASLPTTTTSTTVPATTTSVPDVSTTTTPPTSTATATTTTISSEVAQVSQWKAQFQPLITQLELSSGNQEQTGSDPTYLKVDSEITALVNEVDAGANGLPPDPEINSAFQAVISGVADCTNDANPNACAQLSLGALFQNLIGAVDFYSAKA